MKTNVFWRTISYVFNGFCMWFANNNFALIYLQYGIDRAIKVHLWSIFLRNPVKFLTQSVTIWSRWEQFEASKRRRAGDPSSRYSILHWDSNHVPTSFLLYFRAHSFKSPDNSLKTPMDRSWARTSVCQCPCVQK